MEFVIGGVAGMCAALFSNPLDVVKTRHQLQGELQTRGHHAVHYRGVLHAVYVILKTEGATALQKGLVSALWYQLFLNSTRLGLYHVAEVKGWDKNKDGTVSIPRSIVYSALAGTAGGIIGSPAYLVKIQLQSSSHHSIAVGQQHGHKGTWSACRNIYSAHGWRGFFHGVTSAIPRVTIGSAVQLTTFVGVKDELRRRGLFTDRPVVLATIGSAVSGIVVVLIAQPFDVVSTRLYNQGSDVNGRGLMYNGVSDCFRKTIVKEGVLGLYKGFGPAYLRLAPHTVLSLVFWDKLKIYYSDICDRS